jgi:hypothetical protein
MIIVLGVVVVGLWLWWVKWGKAAADAQQYKRRVEAEAVKRLLAERFEADVVRRVDAARSGAQDVISPTGWKSWLLRKETSE